MTLSTATLPDGRTIACVNAYEVEFSWHEIFSGDLADHGIQMPDDGVFFDVGANIGLFSRYVLDRCRNARIFAYEPVVAAFAALECNLAAWSPAARAFPIALGAAPGFAELDYFPAVTALSTTAPAVGRELAAGLKTLLFGGGASDEVRELVAQTGTNQRFQNEADIAHLFRTERLRVAVDTLGAQVQAHGIERIDLLKVDTEGAEKDVLAGIPEALWPKIRQLVVEVHLGEDEADGIGAGLRGRGYRTSISAHPLSQGGMPVYHVYAARPAAGEAGTL